MLSFEKGEQEQAKERYNDNKIVLPPLLQKDFVIVCDENTICMLCLLSLVWLLTVVLLSFHVKFRKNLFTSNNLWYVYKLCLIYFNNRLYDIHLFNECFYSIFFNNSYIYYFIEIFKSIYNYILFFYVITTHKIYHSHQYIIHWTN